MNQEYLRYLEADLQQSKALYDQALEQFKEAEKRIIGSQYALQNYLEYFSKAEGESKK
jgi:hypothetical protein